MSAIEIKVPDIGDFAEVTVIELMVKPGDSIKAEQSLITVESDKASMEIPSSHAGVVKELRCSNRICACARSNASPCGTRCSSRRSSRARASGRELWWHGRSRM